MVAGAMGLGAMVGLGFILSIGLAETDGPLSVQSVNSLSMAQRPLAASFQAAGQTQRSVSGIFTHANHSTESSYSFLHQHFYWCSEMH
jgi:hypothetical protein